MNNKILLLSVAVLAVGLFAMPSTLSLFTGQHTFYSGENVKCEKCHQDVYNEIAGTSTAHNLPALKECQGCHKTTRGTNFSGNIPINATANGSFTLYANGTGGVHAAVTLECITCHGGVDEELRGANEAHQLYYYKSANTTNTSAGLTTVNNTVIKLKGANTACIGCHTHAVVNITWVRSTGYNMTVDGTGGSWAITFYMNTTTANRSSAGE